MVLSEFVNRCLRLEHGLLVDNGVAHKDFKTYRASQEYSASCAAVARAAQNILNYCQRIPDDFDQLNPLVLLNTLQNSQSDLNDLLIIETCQRRNLTLVTEDADFKGCNLPILTNNGAYFRP